jgi:hypothetical protein
VSELLPDKFTSVEDSIVGHAARLFGALAPGPLSVGALYVATRRLERRLTFDSFADAAAFLYGAGAIDYVDGLVRRS